MQHIPMDERAGVTQPAYLATREWHRVQVQAVGFHGPRKARRLPKENRAGIPRPPEKVEAAPWLGQERRYLPSILQIDSINSPEIRTTVRSGISHRDQQFLPIIIGYCVEHHRSRSALDNLLTRPRVPLAEQVKPRLVPHRQSVVRRRPNETPFALRYLHLDYVSLRNREHANDVAILECDERPIRGKPRRLAGATVSQAPGRCVCSASKPQVIIRNVSY